MPVGAFGGKREIMESIAPLGGIYQAGTLSGNPIAMAAGLKTLALISAPNFYEGLTQKTQTFVNAMQQRAIEVGISMTTNTVGGMFGLFFSDEPKISSFAQVMKCDQARFKTFFHGMLAEGIYLAPSAFETGFMSAAHTQEDLEQTLDSASTVFKTL
jgi:glutamate-1-semialdehyde 2,1-aminomutase